MKLSKTGVIKQFELNRVSPETFSLMSQVYAAKMPNLESGRVLPSAQKALIHTVGRPLHKTLESDGDLDGEHIAAMMRAGVAQLHELGFAHCDIALENFFVKATGEIFLGDLEYMQPLDAPAPKTLYRSIPTATTAEDLDRMQLTKELQRLQVLLDRRHDELGEDRA